MAKLTWLGEDEEGMPGPSFTMAFGGIKFPKGEPVEVNDETIVRKARGNQFFSVDDGDAGENDGDTIDKSKSIAELRQMAEDRGIDHEGLSKAELREALSA